MEPKRGGGEGAGTRPADHPSPPGGRRRLPIVPALVFLAVISGLVVLVVIRSSPEQSIRRLIDRQIKLATAARYGQLHATLSARAKAGCPRDVFVGELQRLAASEGNFWGLIDYRDIHVQVRGDRAEVTYVVTYNGRVVERATPENPDLYVRATRTVLGPLPDVRGQLATLDREHSNQPGIGALLNDKQYRAAKARVLKLASVRPVLYQKGQWYDDLDRHVRCGE